MSDRELNLKHQKKRNEARGSQSVICSIFKTQKFQISPTIIFFYATSKSRCAWRCYCIEYFIRSERESDVVVADKMDK